MKNPVLERRQEEKVRRRQEILDVADELFRQHGFFETSIDKIAHEASLGKGTVYYYYENKEQILTDLMKKRLWAAVRNLQERLRDVAGLEQALLISATAALEFLDEHMPSLHVLMRDSERFAAKCPAEWVAMTRLLRGVRRLGRRWMLALLRADGVTADPDMVVDVITSLVMGAAHQRFHQPKAPSALFENFGEVIRIFVRGLPRSHSTSIPTEPSR